MIIIGEKLNSSIPSTQALLAARDEAGIRELVRRQKAAGADWLDLNAGMFLEQEADLLSWMADIVIQEGDVGLVLDSPDAAVLEQVGSSVSGCPIMLNSATLEPDRFQRVVSLAIRTGASLIALPILGKQLPADILALTDNAESMLNALHEAGMPNDRIFLDILVSAAAVDDQAPRRSLTLAETLRSRHPDLHLAAGISNVSFGLPVRHSLNAAFLTAAVVAGVDAPIVDVLDTSLMQQLAAARLIAGADEFCMDYLGYVRGNR